MHNISRSKRNWNLTFQTLEFDQVKEHNKRNTFLQKSCRKWGRETSSAPLFAFWNSFIWGKSKRSAAQYVLIDLNLAYETIKQYSMKTLIQNIKKLCATLNYWPWDMLDFDFFRKGLGIVFSPHFAYDL